MSKTHEKRKISLFLKKKNCFTETDENTVTKMTPQEIYLLLKFVFDFTEMNKNIQLHNFWKKKFKILIIFSFSF